MFLIQEKILQEIDKEHSLLLVFLLHKMARQVYIAAVQKLDYSCCDMLPYVLHHFRFS